MVAGSVNLIRSPELRALEALLTEAYRIPCMKSSSLHGGSKMPGQRTFQDDFGLAVYGLCLYTARSGVDVACGAHSVLSENLRGSGAA
ncbi:hypothetical protein ABAC402_05200 [Asticcacaulis sp. AC402]|nr:hypothetical protein ABAC402_05200 [Asticcacaulis sp. AC402]